MFKRFAAVTVLCAALFASTPTQALAYAFGGQTSLVLPCFLFGFVPYGSISLVGPPDPGLYIWTPFTETYQNGPPTHPGQWLLGLTSIPYICVVFPVGPIIVPGMVIGMMGSSGSGGSAAPAIPAYTPPVGGGGTSGGGGASGSF